MIKTKRDSKMSKRTGVIRYNLHDTGRQFTGQARKLDIPAAMRLFNGPTLQESIRKGDIVGYVGHQWREKYGLDVPEVVVVDGKQVVLEPAVKTISARCLPDGWLEHEQEFLDTAPGRIAQRLWEGKSWGFSSAIHAPAQGGLRVPLGYFGMDFVRAPNYDDNRGYGAMLDSVGPGCFEDAGMYVADTAALYDSVDSMIRDSDEAARGISEFSLHLCAQNDELLEENAKLLERLRAANIAAPMLDKAPNKMQRPMVVDKGQSMLDSARKFMTSTLPAFEEPANPNAEKEAQEAAQATEHKGLLKQAIGLVDSILGAH